MNFPFYIDIINQRVVYSGDLLVGRRSITLDKGDVYNCAVTFYSGLNPVSLNVSGFNYNIVVPNNFDYPLVSSNIFNGSAFPLTVISSVLDYAIGSNPTLSALSNITFSGNGNVYNIQPLPTQITNNYVPSNSQATISGIEAQLSGLMYWAINTKFLVTQDSPDITP